MKITINQISPRRTDGEVTSVKVHFTARTSDDSINLSGSIPIGNFTESINFGAIEGAVKQEVIEKIMNGEVDAE